jgi:hypothetical protein
MTGLIHVKGIAAAAATGLFALDTVTAEPDVLRYAITQGGLFAVVLVLLWSIRRDYDRLKDGQTRAHQRADGSRPAVDDRADEIRGVAGLDGAGTGRDDAHDRPHERTDLMDITAHSISRSASSGEGNTGAASTPLILAMLQLDGDWPNSPDDLVPWCSGFTNFVCWLLGCRARSRSRRSHGSAWGGR